MGRFRNRVWGGSAAPVVRLTGPAWHDRGVMWFFALVIVVLIGAVAVVASGRWGGMAEVYDDRPDVLVPARRALTADDIESSRFAVGVRGYRMDEVDTLLERVAREVAERDRRIAALERAQTVPAFTYADEPVAETAPAETPPAEAAEPAEPTAPLPTYHETPEVAEAAQTAEVAETPYETPYEAAAVAEEEQGPATVTPEADDAGTVSTEVYDAGSIFAPEPSPEPKPAPEPVVELPVAEPKPVAGTKPAAEPETTEFDAIGEPDAAEVDDASVTRRH
ncbi:DivIVA domain-containing protein [Kribbella sp. NBC_01245]|uniref:DivIVA domain-containing protein n=1 Tax=Kribbella sp. NBC_01245 TaxID=2903578 RepID=UPI002E2D1B42|nr:DivIVA domain-containing protein [Kribbella sp. NBC_01245]